MIRKALIVSSILATCATVSSLHAADEPYDGRSANVGAKGTGPATHDEGVRVGAPGAIVTATKGGAMLGHDANTDGFISKAEAEKNVDLAENFAKLDSDNDGKLNDTEFQKFVPDESAVTTHPPVYPDGTGTRTP